MTTAIVIVAGICAVIAFLLIYRKDAGDAREGQANKEALNEAVEANAPPTADELKRVQQSFRRD